MNQLIVYNDHEYSIFDEYDNQEEAKSEFSKSSIWLGVRNNPLSLNQNSSFYETVKHVKDEKIHRVLSKTDGTLLNNLLKSSGPFPIMLKWESTKGYISYARITKTKIKPRTV